MWVYFLLLLLLLLLVCLWHIGGGGGSKASLLTCSIAGSVAGAVGVGVSYPLDTIKTKQQVLSSLSSLSPLASPMMIATPSLSPTKPRYHVKVTSHKDGDSIVSTIKKHQLEVHQETTSSFVTLCKLKRRHIVRSFAVFINHHHYQQSKHLWYHPIK
jgi:Mitochondrial carrier protein